MEEPKSNPGHLIEELKLLSASLFWSSNTGVQGIGFHVHTWRRRPTRGEKGRRGDIDREERERENVIEGGTIYSLLLGFCRRPCCLIIPG